MFLLFFFFLFCFFFLCFHFLRFSNPKKHEKNPSLENIFFYKLFLCEFFLKGNIFEHFLFKNYHLKFSSKKKNFSKKKKTFFFIHMRRRAHTRLKALLTIAASRGVVERVRSMCIQLSLISSAGHSLHQPISLFSCFFKKKKTFCFPYFSDFFASIVL